MSRDFREIPESDHSSVIQVGSTRVSVSDANGKAFFTTFSPLGVPIQVLGPRRFAAGFFLVFKWGLPSRNTIERVKYAAHVVDAESSAFVGGWRRPWVPEGEKKQYE